MSNGREREPAYQPTPEQIAKACAEIQAGWTDEDRWLRINPTLRPKAWEFERSGRIRFER